MLGGTPRAFLCNKKVKQRACLGSSWTRQSADMITSAGRWRLYAPWGLSCSFFLSVKPLSMQKGPITGWTIMIPSPLLMFQQEFNNSTGFYLSVLNYSKISKTSFPSEYGYLIAQMGPFFPSLKTMKVGHVIWKTPSSSEIPQVCVLSSVQLSNPMDCSLPGSSVHGIIPARKLEWVAISSYRRSSWLRDQTCISCSSCISRQILYHWTTL